MVILPYAAVEFINYHYYTKKPHLWCAKKVTSDSLVDIVGRLVHSTYPSLV